MHFENLSKLTIEFEEVSETSKPRDVEIIKTSDQELGFILWFDDNGHYIEDVTIGTPAYEAGLRQEGVGKTFERSHRNRLIFTDFCRSLDTREIDCSK